MTTRPTTALNMFTMQIVTIPPRRRRASARRYSRPDGTRCTIERRGSKWEWWNTDANGVGPIDGMTGECDTLRDAMDDAEVTATMRLTTD